jgi:hypothetical protein
MNLRIWFQGFSHSVNVSARVCVELRNVWLILSNGMKSGSSLHVTAHFRLRSPGLQHAWCSLSISRSSLISLINYLIKRSYFGGKLSRAPHGQCVLLQLTEPCTKIAEHFWKAEFWSTQCDLCQQLGLCACVFCACGSRKRHENGRMHDLR